MSEKLFFVIATHKCTVVDHWLQHTAVYKFLMGWTHANYDTQNWITNVCWFVHRGFTSNASNAMLAIEQVTWVNTRHESSAQELTCPGLGRGFSPRCFASSPGHTCVFTSPPAHMTDQMFLTGSSLPQLKYWTRASGGQVGQEYMYTSSQDSRRSGWCWKQPWLWLLVFCTAVGKQNRRL